MSQYISTERLQELLADVESELVCAVDTEWNRSRNDAKRDMSAALLELKRRREVMRQLEDSAHMAFHFAPKES